MKKLSLRTRKIFGITGAALAPVIGGAGVGLYAHETAESALSEQSGLRTEMVWLDEEIAVLGGAIISYTSHLPVTCVGANECPEFPEAFVVLNSLQTDLATAEKRYAAIPNEISASERENTIKPKDVPGFALIGVLVGLVFSAASVYSVYRDRRTDPENILPTDRESLQLDDA